MYDIYDDEIDLESIWRYARVHPLVRLRYTPANKK